MRTCIQYQIALYVSSWRVCTGTLPTGLHWTVVQITPVARWIWRIVSRKWWRPTGANLRFGQIVCFKMMSQRERFRTSKSRFAPEFQSKDLRIKPFDLIFLIPRFPPSNHEQESSNQKLHHFPLALELIGSTFGAAKFQDEASALGWGPSCFFVSGGFVVQMEEVEIMRISWKPIYTYEILNIQYMIKRKSIIF